jgi:pyruvate/2-oxoglutarate dehydrogenase complex dihydrolipoamide acyltransferase (E2) component
VVEWLKKEWDTVQKGEPILVAEGEKTTFKVEAPENGALTKILATPGTDVEVSHPVAVIGESFGSLAAIPTEGRQSAPAPAQSQSSKFERPASGLGER